MTEVSELFTTSTMTPWQVATMGQGGSTGFKIPEYQRTYDWSEENIDRLMQNIFSGFESMSRNTEESSFTFLGTLILVEEKIKESSFRCQSYSIVDGQQRLTTLTLLACALIERLRIRYNELPKLPANITEWLKNENDDLVYDLNSCVCGQQRSSGRKFHPFPRIVRDLDTRGDSFQSQELNSSIAIFLSKFDEYIQENTVGNTEFEIPDLGKSRDAKNIERNYKILKKFCKHLNDPDWFNEKDCSFLSEDKIFSKGYNGLWKKNQDVPWNESAKGYGAIKKRQETHAYFRTLMIAAYFRDYIAVTTVVTKNETAAFDIFDSLNTTGEPLTALETLKPHVIKNHKNEKYKGSKCEQSFNQIEQNLDEFYPDTNQKQDETKKLIVSFSLYLEGKKIPLNSLSAQRRELLNSFKSSNNSNKFMEALADVSEYRCNFWIPKNINLINKYHQDPKQAGEVKLLSTLLYDMKTTLTIPILSRYWVVGKNEQNFDQFIEVLKALTAFLVLRRAITESTAGIDTCFREIMEEAGQSDKKFGLCIGSSFQNQILDIQTLKNALRNKLQSPKVKFENREDWINLVIDFPIYNNRQPLTRFLLFAATHNTSQDPDELGLLTRDNIQPSDDRKYLTFEKWNSELYKTVEHVAPNSDKSKGWDTKIYNNPRIRNTLGNLVLLPAKENASIGNAPWVKKKIFYKALTDKTLEERKSSIKRAEKKGLEFNKLTKKLINEGERLSMLDRIQDVERWDKDFIEKRTRRIASLAWDQLWPWLNN